MSQQEYTIHIFGQDITSQDGLFRLDEIRRVGIQIGKVEDTEKTMIKRFAQTKVGRYLMGQKNRRIKKVDMGRFMRTKAGRSLTNPENGFVKKINMGHLGTISRL